MRERALTLAELDRPDLDTIDVGAGTGFATEGILAAIDAGRVLMLDQSPDQLGRARRKPTLDACRKVLGDAEHLQLSDRSFDRYVSCGSIEYWPDPQQAVLEAHRVLRPGGVAMIAGPLAPSHGAARKLADTWMLFPTEAEYRDLFDAAGFEDVRTLRLPAPWEDAAEATSGYAIAISGRATDEGPPRRSPATVSEAVDEAWTIRRLLRFAAGALAGAAFVPLGIVLNARATRKTKRT